MCRGVQGAYALVWGSVHRDRTGGIQYVMVEETVLVGMGQWMK